MDGKTKFELELCYRRIRYKEYISDLRSVGAVLRKNSVTINEYDKYGKFSAGTMASRFGSWIKALKKFVEYVNSGELDITEVTVKLAPKNRGPALCRKGCL